MGSEKRIMPSTGNVFKDLGLQSADELLARAELSVAVLKRVQASGLTQADAARLLGISESELGEIMRGHVDNWTSTQLEQLLLALPS
jgi:predicted XRE-type DNA-binding protein